KDWRGAALRRRRALQGELGQPPRSGDQLQQGADQRLDAAPSRHPRQGEGSALDQSRQGTARWAEAIARLLRVSATIDRVRNDRGAYPHATARWKRGGKFTIAKGPFSRSNSGGSAAHEDGSDAGR